MKDGALSDLKVVEYAEGIAGPYCVKLLADLGAEVIKVETPDSGDATRRSGPFPDDLPHPEMSGLFLYLNANKLGITLNVHSAIGATVFKELVAEADILVEAFPPGFMASLGLDYETLIEINPGLIVTSITPFGQTGPYRDFTAGELIIFHMGGLGYETPGAVDEPEAEPPVKAWGHQAEFLAGTTATLLTLCAVFSRAVNGLGQHIDLSQQEAAASLLRGSTAAVAYGVPQAPNRSPALQIPMRRSFMGNMPCRDGYVCLTAIEDHHWQRFVRLMGDPEWAKEDMCQNFRTRAEHADILEPKILEWTMKHTKDEISALAQEVRIPCFPVNDIEEVVNYHQLMARDYFVQIEHPEAGEAKFPGAPYKLSRTPWQMRRPAPRLGEHNQEVLGRLGYTEADVVKMRQASVI